MKRSVMFVFGVLLTANVYAGNFIQVDGNRQDRIISELQDNNNRLASGGTLTNGLTVAGAALVLSNGVTLAGTTAFTSTPGISVSSNRFLVNGATGKVDAGGAMSITGAVTMASTLNVSSTLTETLGMSVSSNRFLVNGATGNFDFGGNGTVTGTLAVVGVATFTAEPVMTSTTAAGTATITLISNAPALNATNAPIWVDVKVGTNDCVMPVWQK